MTSRSLWLSLGGGRGSASRGNTQRAGSYEPGGGREPGVVDTYTRTSYRIRRYCNRLIRCHNCDTVIFRAVLYKLRCSARTSPEINGSYPTCVGPNPCAGP